MKRISLLIIFCFAFCAVQAQSRIEEFTVTSKILGVEKTCTVYLPNGYADSGKSYPVLYLLHGASGYHGDWTKQGDMRTTADEAIKSGSALPMIVIMPDASGEGERYTGRGMGYFNVPGWNYEQFFFEEFIPAVEKHYRIVGDKKHRAISGLSMGGGGTAVYAMRHSELFGSACPLSGLLGAHQTRAYDSDFSKSTVDNNPIQILQDMSDEDIAKIRTVRWWIDCGDDDFLYEYNIDFYRAMRKRHIPVEYRMRDGGHTWRYWQTALPGVLTFVSMGFAE